MARSSSGIFVAGLTAAAVAVVAVLAVQAAAAKDEADETAGPAPTVSAPAEQGSAGEPETDPKALPSGSGEGRRVVYSLEADRVWLVDDQEKVTRTYVVRPGSVDPLPGSYTVTSRSAHITGTDNVPVENVVRFANVDGVTIGFSAAIHDRTESADESTGGTGATPATGGIRESREDGEAMWLFATLDTTVVVLP